MKILIIIQFAIIIGLLSTFLWKGFDVTGAIFDTQMSYPDKSFMQFSADINDDATHIKYIMFSKMRGEMIELQGKSRFWPKDSPEYLRIRRGSTPLVNICLSKKSTMIITIDQIGDLEIYSWTGNHHDFKEFFQPYANRQEESVSGTLTNFLKTFDTKLELISQHRA